MNSRCIKHILFCCIYLFFNVNLVFPYKSNDRLIFENWITVIEEEYQKESEQLVYDRISERFLELYYKTGNHEYLNFALHEASQAQLPKIVESLSKEEKEKVSDIIDKLLHRKIDSSYFEISDFSSSEIYRFIRVDIPNELTDQANELLTYWKESLDEIYQQDYLKASFKAQALIWGYFSLNNDEKVVNVGRYLIESHPFPPSTFTLDLFNFLAFSARSSGYIIETLDLYQNILLDLVGEIGSLEQYLITKMDYSSVLFRIGNVNAAYEQYEEVYSEIENLNNPRYRAALFNNLAVSYLNAGQFDRYVQFQLNAYEIAQNENNYEQQISILRNLFIFYRRQDDTDLALNYLNRALELSQQFDMPTETASILISMGVYSRTVEEHLEEALGYFYEAKELSSAHNNFRHQYNSFIELAETYLLLQNYSQSEHYFKEAIDQSSSRGDERGYFQAAVRYANLLSHDNRPDEARALLDEFSHTELHQLPFNTRVLASNVKNRLLIEEYPFEAADQSSAIIEEIISWLRESMDHQTGHMRMDDEFTEAFRLHTALMYETGRYEQALSTIGELRNLSRTGFYNNPLLKSKVLSEEELIREYNLSNQIQSLRNRYAGATTDEQRVYLGNELVNTISERNNLLNNAFPQYEVIRYDQQFRNIRRNIQSDQAVIYFSVFENQIFQFIITRSGIKMDIFPDDPSYLAMINDAVATFGYGTTNLEKLHRIYQTYFEDRLPRRINHLYIIPDGEFFRLPVEILPIEPVRTASSYGSSKYLIEKYSVSYLNTLSDLIKTDSEQPDFTYDLAGFGINDFSAAGHPHLPDLPFSPREITQSAEKLDQFPNKTFFLNQESTESNFRNIAGNARILHLATHSTVDDENPLFSALYLFGSKNELEDDEEPAVENNGIVHAYELFDMNLNADLVFLSSCESGTGGYLRGAGILGFSRAFSYAGAKSLSINLWPIRDQTASEISMNFYESLNTGEDKANSLRAAKLSYLNNNNSDPYLWGSFVIYGDISSPLAKDKMPLTQYLFSLMIFIGLTFIFVLMYQNKNLIKTWLF